MTAKKIVDTPTPDPEVVTAIQAIVDEDAPKYDTGRVLDREHGEGSHAGSYVSEVVNDSGIKRHPADVAEGLHGAPDDLTRAPR